MGPTTENVFSAEKVPVDMKKTKPSQMITGNQRLTMSIGVLGILAIP